MMKFLLFTLLATWCAVGNPVVWHTDFATAQTEATATQKRILLNFSGSDWCIPCRKMKKYLFADSLFTNFAEQHLVLVNADFPRLKENKISKAQMTHNEQLAERYNPSGLFPMTVLLDSAGNVLKAWEGNPKTDTQSFVSSIQEALRHE